MPSTVIRLISYDDTTRRLSVTFITGRAYVYEDVPEEVYRDFLAAESKGRFFNDIIRDHYAFRRIPRGGHKKRSAA